MRCEPCQGSGWAIGQPCEECGGCGIVHCCEGLIENTDGYLAGLPARFAKPLAPQGVGIVPSAVRQKRS